MPGQVEGLGITEEQRPRTAEAIAEWLLWFDSIEPIEMTPEEEAGSRILTWSRGAFS